MIQGKVGKESYIQVLRPDDEHSCMAGFEVGIRIGRPGLFRPELFWGWGLLLSNRGYFKGSYYDYGEMFETNHLINPRGVNGMTWLQFARNRITHYRFKRELKAKYKKDQMNNIPF
jgi:hypothetical protein